MRDVELIKLERIRPLGYVGRWCKGAAEVIMKQVLKVMRLLEVIGGSAIGLWRT